MRDFMSEYRQYAVGAVVGFFAFVALLGLTGCATVDRFLASDVSIVEAATTIETLLDRDIDMTEPDDRRALYASLDAYREYASGDIDENEFVALLGVIWTEDPPDAAEGD